MEFNPELGANYCANQSLDGKIIYNYPLKDAQIDGYFKVIEFHPVREYNLELADKAVELLRNDRAQGFKHLLMVRARSQKRAAALFELSNSMRIFRSSSSTARCRIGPSYWVKSSRRNTRSSSVWTCWGKALTCRS